MFPLLHYGEACGHSRSGVMWLLKLYKGIQLLPSFLVMLTLRTCPMMEDAQAAWRSLADSSIWSLHWQPLQPPDMEGGEHLDGGVLAMELPQLRSWCGEEVSLTYPSRIPNWPTEPASTVIAALYHSVSFHAVMVAQQLAWRKRSGNNES